MNVIFGFLTVVMFLDCLILMFLVLLQLPKKEAGAGMAFGGAATDALFGAGSGNALTTLTRYTAGIFFGLAIIMAIITTNLQSKTSASEFVDAVTKTQDGGGKIVAPPTAPATTPAANPGGSNFMSSAPPPVAAPVAGTNAALPPLSTQPPPAIATNR